MNFNTHRHSFDLTLLFDEPTVDETLRNKFLGFTSDQKTMEAQSITIPLKNLIAPQSGFHGALCGVYQHVLDTYISVLSSISSHILHAIFYEVIEPILLKIRDSIPKKENPSQKETETD